MARVYLKKSTKTASTGSDDVRATVMGILNDIETGGDAAALEYAAKFDGYDGNLILTEAEIKAACDLVPEKLKQDIQFAHANVKLFAEAQRGTITDFETEVVPGLIAGQKKHPLQCGWLLHTWRTLQPYRQCDYDSDHSEGSRVWAYHSLFASR